jgi:hypothetical protein
MNTTETKVEHTCCEQINKTPGSNWPRFGPCGRRAKVESDGKWYCGIHSPDAKAARDAKGKAAWEADCRRRKWIGDCLDACAGIADPQSAITAARDALMDSVKAAEYVVRLIEQTGKAGVSPNPMEKANWLGATMHCYAAMSFIKKARQALEGLG